MKRGRLVAGAMLVLAGMVFVPPVLAGDLNPPGAPAPTMKTLDEIPGSWHRILPAADRFRLVMPTTANPAGEAVLDKETGLVWEKSPAATPLSWVNAINACLNGTVGGRKGWRLPTIEELASLVDPSVIPPGPSLPVGHPFANVQSALYFSASTYAANSIYAWAVNFWNGWLQGSDKTTTIYVWCARAGRGIDGQ